uniref:Saposin B-type domain-containing protein n=1 Tax=Panagrellus redivivus TaxID=6233 RepID=A0A7E4VGB9_PANRE
MKFVAVVIFVFAFILATEAADPITCALCKATFNNLASSLAKDQATTDALATELSTKCNTIASESAQLACATMFQPDNMPILVTEFAASPDVGTTALCTQLEYC